MVVAPMVTTAREGYCKTKIGGTPQKRPKQMYRPSDSGLKRTRWPRWEQGAVKQTDRQTPDRCITLAASDLASVPIQCW